MIPSQKSQSQNADNAWHVRIVKSRNAQSELQDRKIGFLFLSRRFRHQSRTSKSATLAVSKSVFESHAFAFLYNEAWLETYGMQNHLEKDRQVCIRMLDVYQAYQRRSQPRRNPATK